MTNISKKELEDFSSILDCNKGEKLILEFNNLICVGEYELSRPFLKKMRTEIPLYYEYFFKLIFTRGVPQKWLLTNQIRTSSHYIWLLYQDYLKYSNKNPDFLQPHFINSIQFDLIISDIYYNSCNTLNYKFLFDLRNIFNALQAKCIAKEYFLPELRLISPDKRHPALYLSIKDCYYKNDNVAIDFRNSEAFFIDIKKVIFSQRKTFKFAYKKILSLYTTNEKVAEQGDVRFFEEKVFEIFCEFIIHYITTKEYDKIYDFLKYIQFNKKIQKHHEDIEIVFSLIVMVSNSQQRGIKREFSEILEFVKFCIKKIHPNVSIEKYELKQFNIEKNNSTINIVKIYESLLANDSSELISKLKDIQDIYIEYECSNKGTLHYFFQDYKKDKKINVFFNDYINYLRIHKEHCLGYALMESINQINKESFKTAIDFLHPMNNLKVLLIVLVWNSNLDINFRNKVIETVWKSYNEHKSSSTKNSIVSFLEDVVISLSYTIKNSFWVAKKIQKNPSDVYNELLNNSVAFTVKDSIPELSQEDITKRFFSFFPSGNISVIKHHFHSTMMFYSLYLYCFVFKKIDEIVLGASSSLKISKFFSEKEKEEITRILNKIIIFPFRLNIIFDFLNVLLLHFEKKENEEKTSRLLSYGFQKKFFEEFLSILLGAVEPFRNFDFDRLDAMFEKEFLDSDIGNEIEKSSKDLKVNLKSVFVESFKESDIDFLNQSGEKDYQKYLKIKTESLISHLDEIKFRYEIINNSWLEVIYSNKGTKISFLEALMQVKEEYLQIAKKYHEYDVAKKIISCFELPQSENSTVDYLSENSLIKKKFEEETPNIQINQFINGLSQRYGNDLDKLFSLCFNMALNDKITMNQSLELIEKSISFLREKGDDDINLYENLLEKYKDLNDSSATSTLAESLNKIVVTNFNLIQSTAPLKIQTAFLKSKEKSIQNLYDLSIQKNVLSLSNEDVMETFKKTLEVISNYESQNKETEKTPNYLKIFLTYLMNIGDVYFNARAKVKSSSFNYFKILKKIPEKIIANLLFKYDDYEGALKIICQNNMNFINVITNYSYYFAKGEVNHNEFCVTFAKLIKGELGDKTALLNLRKNDQWIKKEKCSSFSLKNLESVYKTDQLNFYAPLIISLYRIDFDLLSGDEKYKFWEMMINRYSSDKVYGKYIKKIFLKFYLLAELIGQGDTYKPLLKSFADDNETTNKYKKVYKKLKEKNDSEIFKSKDVFKHKNREGIALDKKALESKLLNYIKEKSKNNLKAFSQTPKGNLEEVPENLDINFHDLTIPTAKKEEYFYKVLSEKSINQGKFDLAFELADKHLISSKNEVIEKLISKYISSSKSPDEKKLIKYLLRLTNKQKIFEYVLKYKYDWSADSLLSLLYILKDELKSNEIDFLINKLVIFKQILKETETTLTFSQMEIQCNQNISVLLEKLMSRNCHDICYKLTLAYNEYDKYKNVIKFSEVKYLLSLNTENDKAVAMKKIKEIDPSEIILFCIKLIKELEYYNHKLLVIKFLLENYQTKLDETTLLSLKNQEIGIKIYFLSPEEKRIQIQSIISFPLLLTETFLLNEDFEVVEKIFNMFPQIGSQMEHIVIFYAEKSMTLYDSSEKKSENEKEKILTNQNKDNVRSTFRFENTPNFELFLKLTKLVKNKIKIYKISLVVCNSLSKYLNSDNDSIKPIALKNIDLLLNFLQGQIESSPLNQIELTEYVNKLLFFIKLKHFSEIFLKNHIEKIVSIEYDKIYTSSKEQCNIRDTLIKNNYLDIAKEFCNQINIDSKPVEKQIGLQNIKLKKYSEARFSFSKILVKNSENSIIDEIVSMLAKNISVDEKENIVSETLFYLRVYGTTKQLINFYIENDMINEAIDYIMFNRNISTNFFIDEICNKCYTSNKMDDLVNSLKGNLMIRERESFSKELVSILISFLKNKNSLQDLIKVYEALNHNVEAMLVSIQLAKSIDDFEKKQELYIEGKKNLELFLNNSDDNSVEIFDSQNGKSETKKINRSKIQYLGKLLKFQIRVMEAKKDIPYSLLVDKEDNLYSICQEIICLDSSLTLELIKEFNLVINKIILNSVTFFLKKEDYDSFEKLLVVLKDWNSKKVFDDFNENFYTLWNDVLAMSMSHIDLEKKRDYVKENIISRMTNDFLRMQSLFLIGEFQNAAILAVQINNKEMLSEIKAVAKERNMTEVLEFISNLE